jgi:5'-nucleotidase / UDP-sugar diphosphatase
MTGVAPAPGTMRFYAAKPNPNAAAASQLFLFSGDATAAPIQTIELAPGVVLPAPPHPDSHDFNLRIFHFNDLHGHLMRFTPGGEESVLPRIAGKIHAARQKCRDQSNAAVLAFSAGDDCTGSIFDEILTDKSQDHPVHPGYQLYSKMGVDLAGLGNHDLDRGLPFLADAIRHNAHFPVLAANLTSCPEISDVCHPAALLVVKGIRIGLIGLVTRAETHIDPDICKIVNPIPVAQNLVPALRPLCDVLIIISHLGYSLQSPVPMADAGDIEVARNLPFSSVDLIIGGHSHTALNANGLAAENVVNGIPIVQTGARGEFLGEVVLEICCAVPPEEHLVNHRADSARILQRPSALSREVTPPDGNVQTTISSAILHPTAELPRDGEFEAEMQPFITYARRLWNQPVGQVDDLPDLNTKIILTDFAKREMALANFVTDALVVRMTQRGFPVDFAMIDASALQCGLPYSDNLTFGDCFEVMPFADTVRLYQITGRQLQALLTDNAQRLDSPGKPDLERGFLQFSREVQYSLVPGTNPQTASALDISFNETPVEQLSSATFTVATSSFIRRLSEPWIAQWQTNQTDQLMEINQYPFTDTDFLLRNEMVQYIKEHGGVTRQNGAHCDGRLRIMERE